VECGPHAAIKVETSSAADAIILRVTISVIVKLFRKAKLSLCEVRSRKLGSTLESRNHKMYAAAALFPNGSPPLWRLRA
jgi:hypothetical protein